MTRENDMVHTKLARQVGGAIACLLAAALLLELTACGGGQAKGPEDKPPAVENMEPSPPEPDGPLRRPGAGNSPNASAGGRGRA